MPWSNQSGGDKDGQGGGKKSGNGGKGGGGPWGSAPSGGGNGGNSGPQKPWGRPGTGGGGGSGSGSPSPDLDALIRNGRERLRRVMPGGFGEGYGFIGVLAVILVLWIFTGFYVVQPDEQGVVLQLGKFDRLADPGWRYHLPMPLESVQKVKVGSENTMAVGHSGMTQSQREEGDEDTTMLTGDENVIDTNFVVKWRIKDAKEFLFSVRDVEETIRRVAESAMREIIGRSTIQQVLTGDRQQIATDAKDMMQKILDNYAAGILVADVQITKVSPPSEVVEAFNDVQNALLDKERASNDADAYVNGIIPQARGEAQRLLADADGYRQQVVDLATGEAKRFLSVLEAHDKAKDLTEKTAVHRYHENMC